MPKYITSTDQSVALNAPIPFDVVSIPCRRGCVVPITTGVVTLSSGKNQAAQYRVEAQANVAIPEGGTVTPIALALTINGVSAGDSVAIVTPAAAEELWHVNTSTIITVPCGCCVSVSAEYVDATEDDAATTPTPSVFVRRRASLTVARIA